MLISSSFSSWNPWRIMPQLVTIVLTAIIIIFVSLIYNYKVKKMKADEDPKGIVLIVELIIRKIEQLVIENLGIKFKNVTIYLLYLILYILIGNWLSIIGLESQMSSYTVTLSLALVTFIGIYYVGFKFQKFLFLKKYINPLEMITQFAPLISLSFRLFGNIIGGSIILTLLYGVTGNFWAKIPVIGQANFLMGGIGPFVHMYFDLFAGSIQALIFGVLTLVYWKLEIESGKETELEIKLSKKIRKKRYKNDNEIIYSERELLDSSLKKRRK